MNTSDTITIREATEADINAMLELMEPYVQQKLVLRRTREELAGCLDTFVLSLDNDTGHLLGLGALRPYGNGIFEIRSLAVDCNARHAGIGRRLVQALLDKGLHLQPPALCIFALTKCPEFFAKLGFVHAPKERFPDKIWADCRLCPNFHSCDEVAMEYQGK